MGPANFFNKEQKEKIIQAIKDAENQTSGEIRLHLESVCKGDALERAVQMFEKLKMHETQLRNGTLIYLALKEKKFAIFGDEGINEIVPDNFWQDVKDEMRSLFIKGDFLGGLTRGIYLVGEKLKTHFPYQEDDENELPDDISMGCSILDTGSGSVSPLEGGLRGVFGTDVDVDGRWSMVDGRWSMVDGRWNLDKR